MRDLAAFIGIDLAWGTKNNSGIAVLRGDQRGASLEDIHSIPSADVQEYVESHAAENMTVAIDAPLIITNKIGQRPCETLVSKFYSRQHAGCHSSNLSLHPRGAGVCLAKNLESALGFRHATTSEYRTGRIMLEVFPHPAIVELFQLQRIIKYKKGTVAQRRSGQRELQRQMKRLCSLSPQLIDGAKLSGFLETNTETLKGAALKDNEDRLDALICAYIAYYFWFWGPNRVKFFGKLESGYIAVPLLTPLN